MNEECVCQENKRKVQVKKKPAAKKKKKKSGVSESTVLFFILVFCMLNILSSALNAFGGIVWPVAIVMVACAWSLGRFLKDNKGLLKLSFKNFRLKLEKERLLAQLKQPKSNSSEKDFLLNEKLISDSENKTETAIIVKKEKSSFKENSKQKFANNGSNENLTLNLSEKTLEQTEIDFLERLWNTPTYER